MAIKASLNNINKSAKEALADRRIQDISEDSSPKSTSRLVADDLVEAAVSKITSASTGRGAMFLPTGKRAILGRAISNLLVRAFKAAPISTVTIGLGPIGLLIATLAEIVRPSPTGKGKKGVLGATLEKGVDTDDFEIPDDVVEAIDEIEAALPPDEAELTEANQQFNLGRGTLPPSLGVPTGPALTDPTPPLEVPTEPAPSLGVPTGPALTDPTPPPGPQINTPAPVLPERVNPVVPQDQVVGPASPVSNNVPEPLSAITTFEKAFQAAQDAGLKVFEWRGRMYATEER
jgi:hypothetical protein